MPEKLADSILALAPGLLTACSVNEEVVLYVRETEWGLKKYPVQCPAELKLATWDMSPAVLAVLLLRLGRNDAATFEFWFDPAAPAGARTIQELAAQAHVDAHLVTDRIARSFRVTNEMRYEASTVVDLVHTRRTWPPDAYERARNRICQLYPTPPDLWRSDR